MICSSILKMTCLACNKIKRKMLVKTRFFTQFYLERKFQRLTSFPDLNLKKSALGDWKMALSI